MMTTNSYSLVPFLRAIVGREEYNEKLRESWNARHGKKSEGEREKSELFK